MEYSKIQLYVIGISIQSNLNRASKLVVQKCLFPFELGLLGAVVKFH